MADANVPADDGQAGEKSKMGARFPIISLREAVNIIHEAGAHGVDQSVGAFAGYCGYNSTKSGLFKQKLAACKYWNLLTAAGGRVILTETGKQFAGSAVPLEEDQTLLLAFKSCQIMADFYESQPRNRPIKFDVLGRKAVVDAQVAGSSSTQFVNSFVDSAACAGLAHVNEAASECTFLSVDQVADSTDDREDPPADMVTEDLEKKNPPRPDRQSPPPHEDGSAPIFNQAWKTADGEIRLTITSSKPLPADAFPLIGSTVQAIQQLMESLTATDEVAPNVDA